MSALKHDESLRGRLESFCRSRRVESLYAFGSRAAELGAALEGRRAAPGQASDVDLAVKLSGGRRPAVREKAEMAVELENLLEVDRVDLVVLDQADPFLAVNIIRGERLCCEDDDAADEYELYLLRRAGDLAPFERIRIGRILGATAEG